MPQFPFVETQPYYNYVAVDNGVGTGGWNVVPQQNAFRQIDQLLCSNGDSIDHIIHLYVNDGTHGNQSIGGCTVPARAGYDGAKAADLFALALPASMQPIELDSLWFIGATLNVAMTGATVLTVVAIGGLV